MWSLRSLSPEHEEPEGGGEGGQQAGQDDGVRVEGHRPPPPHEQPLQVADQEGVGAFHHCHGGGGGLEASPWHLGVFSVAGVLLNI